MSINDPKYPEIEVKLVGENGNAFVIMAIVQKAMRKAGLSKAEIDAYHAEAMSGDYDHLLLTTMRYVVVI